MIKNRKGYTLIEVLIVGIIIAILSSVAFSNYGVISEKMKAKEAEQTLRSVLAAFISYQVEHKVNPTTLSQLGVTFPPSIYFDPPTVVAQFIPGRVAQIQRQGPTVTITYSDGRVET